MYAYGEHVTSKIFRVWFVVGRRGLAKIVLFVSSHKAENCGKLMELHCIFDFKL